MIKVASAAGVALATSTFAGWRSIYLNYADKMASVVGLAPTRFGLKGRLRGLLCIHGQKRNADCTFLRCRADGEAFNVQSAFWRSAF